MRRRHVVPTHPAPIVVNIPPVGLPLISGIARDGQTLTAVTSSIIDYDGLGAFSYQWKAGGIDIEGATSSTYVVTHAEVGKTITLNVRYVDGRGHQESITSAATAVVSAVNYAAAGTPLITGTAQVGQTLTCIATSITDANGLGTFSYQWKANGTNIAGATATTYLLTAIEQGKTVTCTVSFTDGDGFAESITSAATASVAAAPPVNHAPTGAPTISGSAVQGQTLTVSTTTIADTDGLGTFSYQWKASGVNISGATATTYLLTASEVGKYITITVSYTDGAGFAESLTSAATATVSPPATTGINLKPTSLTYTDAGGFVCQVQNVGDTAVPPYVAVTQPNYIGVAYYVDGAKVSWGISTIGCDAGATITVGMSTSAPYTLPSGSHSCQVIVDDLNLWTESTETDNTLTVPISGTAGGGGGATVSATILADMYQSTSPTIVMAPSDARAHGITTWDPSYHAIIEYSCPSFYNAMIGWADVYRDETDSADTNTRVAVRNFDVWLLNTSGVWTQITDAANNQISGDLYPENFSGTNFGNQTRTEGDGSFSQKLQHGYVWHFFPYTAPYGRVVIDGSTTVGIVSSYDARLVVDNTGLTDDRATARYLMFAGGDWWRAYNSPHIAYNPDPALTNAAEIGWSKAKRITNNWQTVFFTDIPPATIVANPPPITLI